MVIREEKIGNLKEILNKWYTTTSDYVRDKEELERQIQAALAESKAVNDALNDLYPKINSLIGFTVKIVDELPRPGEFGTVFFKKARNGKNYYEAWVWVDDDYQQVGAIDLSDYALKTEVNSLASELRRTVSGSYNGLMTPAQKNKLDNIQENANNYSLPTASDRTKGGVKVGSNLSMSGDTMNAKDTTYSDASTSSSGLMSAADKRKLNGIADGATAGSYTLPTASTTVKGGIKVGTGLSMSGDTLNCTVSGGSSGGGSGSYTLPTASATVKGGIKVGSGLKMDGETLNCTVSGGSGGSSYTLPTASATQKGGVKIGSGLRMNGETLSTYNPVEGAIAGDSNSANVSLYGNLQIFSWWSGNINAQLNSWQDWHTLPKKNAGKTVWSHDINNTTDGNLYLRVSEGSNKVQYYSTKSGNIPITPGQMVVYVNAIDSMGTFQ